MSKAEENDGRQEDCGSHCGGGDGRQSAGGGQGGRRLRATLMIKPLLTTGISHRNLLKHSFLFFVRLLFSLQQILHALIVL